MSAIWQNDSSQDCTKTEDIQDSYSSKYLWVSSTTEGRIKKAWNRLGENRRKTESIHNRKSENKPNTWRG